ncbi:MAG: DUF6754 domain-containing protein [Anaerolineae bacterium]
MGSQLVALGLALMGVVALAIYGIQQQRRTRKAPPGATQETHAMPVFQAFAHEVGRVAEEGASIHVALGSGDLLTQSGMVSLAALQSLTGLTELSAAYDTPPHLTTGDPTLYLIADTQLRGAYARLGDLRHYRPDFVQFSAPTPLLYAAMAAALAFDEPLGTNINVGTFDQEVTLLTDAAARRKVKTFGGAASAQGLAALYPAVSGDRLVMGEQLFVGGAEVTDRPAWWASLRAENVLRWVVILGILGTAAAYLLESLLGGGG